MNKPKFFPESAFYTVAFLVALGIRLAALGSTFLTNPEAAAALQALHLAQGTHPDIGAQPAVVLFTGSLFFVFGSSEFLARLLPAVVGSLLVFAPALFSNRLGRLAALILAFGLAIDPGLVAMSRQVDGHILALTFTIFAVGFFNRKKAAGTGIFLGLALLGGASVWLGWLILLLTALIYRVVNSRQRDNAGGFIGVVEVESGETSGMVKQALLWFGGTILIAGTLFLLEPKGISAIGGSLVAFIQGLSGAGGVPLSQMLGGLLFYELFPLLLAFFASIRAIIQRNRIDLLLALTCLAAIVLVMINPGRQVADLVWVSLPLWALAARSLAQVPETPLPINQVIGVAILTVVVVVSGWLNFVGAMALQFAEPTQHWVLIILLIFFLGMATILISWGWGLKVAFRGVGSGACFLLLIFTLSAAWKATNQGPRPDQELWQTGGNFKEGGLLLQTANDYSLWNTNNLSSLDLTIVKGSPSLQWMFRNFIKKNYVDVLPVDAAPSMVITPEQASLPLPNPYTGQNFVVEQTPSWPTMSATDWVQWMIFRQAPVTKSTIVLWVKSDLFPGSTDFNQKRAP